MTTIEEKKKIVIDNYFKSECGINTTIYRAFEKGFMIGVKKGHSAQIKVDKWAPCSERPPSEDDTYIVTRKNNFYGGMYIVDSLDYGEPPLPNCTVEGKCWFLYDGEGDYDKVFDDVIAWMPLPEPYKEVMKNEKR